NSRAHPVQPGHRSTLPGVAVRELESEFPRDDHPLDLGSTLADLQNLRVAPEPGHRELVHEPVPAVDLGRLPGVGDRDLARVQLRDGDLAIALRTVYTPRGRDVVRTP